MTTYGTIPTTAPPPAPSPSMNPHFLSRIKERMLSFLGTRRPWSDMLHLQSLALPISAGEALQRMRINATYFRTNYAISVLLILFLWSPISLIVLVLVILSWLFLYFMRDGEEPLVAFGRAIDDWAVLTGLSVMTVAFLLMTNAAEEMAGAAAFGTAAVVAHAAFRRTEDLFVGDDEKGIPPRPTVRGGAGGH